MKGGVKIKQLVIEPNGWPCKLNECPPGHFVIYMGRKGRNEKC
jgi:hypothetical protein